MNAPNTNTTQRGKTNELHQNVVELVMQRNPTTLSTTHKKTPWTITQPQEVNVYYDDNHELVYAQQPWWYATPCYNLPKIATSTSFQNHPPNTDINLVPTNLEMEQLHLLNKLG